MRERRMKGNRNRKDGKDVNIKGGAENRNKLEINDNEHFKRHLSSYLTTHTFSLKH